MRTDDPRHGTYAGANAHWDAGVQICQACKNAATQYHKRRKLRLLQGEQLVLPSDAATRKLRALVALGHGFATIGRHLQASREQVRTWACATHPAISAKNAERIHVTYKALNMEIPSRRTAAEKRAATLAMNLAKRKGWLPPMEWMDIDLNIQFPKDDLDGCNKIDLILVDRLLDGDFSLARAANKAEKDAVVLRWRQLRRSLGELERATGWAAHRYGVSA